MVERFEIGQAVRTRLRGVEGRAKDGAAAPAYTPRLRVHRGMRGQVRSPNPYQVGMNFIPSVSYSSRGSDNNRPMRTLRIPQKLLDEADWADHHEHLGTQGGDKGEEQQYALLLVDNGEDDANEEEMLHMPDSYHNPSRSKYVRRKHRGRRRKHGESGPGSEEQRGTMAPSSSVAPPASEPLPKQARSSSSMDGGEMGAGGGLQLLLQSSSNVNAAERPANPFESLLSVTSSALRMLDAAPSVPLPAAASASSSHHHRGIGDVIASFGNSAKVYANAGALWGKGP